MATITFSHLGFITSISPGQAHHWYYNNAPRERVWAFSVDAMVALDIPPAVNATARVEVTRVEYREIFKGNGVFEKEVHFWVKNTGVIDADYAVHMATIRE